MDGLWMDCGWIVDGSWMDLGCIHSKNESPGSPDSADNL